ncbi:hypothetical protein P0082_09675 [Candidatus Haliotispira prima]|uniref:Uncharacterized protein n=1 Tax=Candidatus Haliotispira prima TaxID=3034016 RepID=A0ABY8MFH2_9SPIO|nr:hypothetical protein P0082_09675 [Candidatus Haliotispira prima]
MKYQKILLTSMKKNSRISNIQYPISNIQYHTTLENKYLFHFLSHGSNPLYSFLFRLLPLLFLSVFGVSLLGCAPLPDTDKDPAPVNPVISFSSAAVASSLQLEISSNIELANIGAVVRLATEAAPTKTEAEASAGHVSISIPAGVSRKISISQHYGSVFTDGLTLADVLAPNTAYKLYLYFPADRITTTAEITGLNVTDDMAAVPFSTAALPAEGDAEWFGGILFADKCVASLDALYFMQEQRGVVVCYSYINYVPLIHEIAYERDDGIFNNIGTYAANMVVPAIDFYFAYGSIAGYTSSSAIHYYYWIATDKERTKIIKNTVKNTVTNNKGRDKRFLFPVTRH